MISVNNPEDAHEQFTAMILDVGWKVFLKKILHPEIVRLRKNIIENENMNEREHYAHVMQLRFIKRLLKTTYDEAVAPQPRELTSWFE